MFIPPICPASFTAIVMSIHVASNLAGRTTTVYAPALLILGLSVSNSLPSGFRLGPTLLRNASTGKAFCISGVNVAYRRSYCSATSRATVSRARSSGGLIEFWAAAGVCAASAGRHWVSSSNAAPIPALHNNLANMILLLDPRSTLRFGHAGLKRAPRLWAARPRATHLLFRRRRFRLRRHQRVLDAGHAHHP